jgi:hypothetical protein
VALHVGQTVCIADSFALCVLNKECRVYSLFVSAGMDVDFNLSPVQVRQRDTD